MKYFSAFFFNANISQFIFFCVFFFVTFFHHQTFLQDLEMLNKRLSERPPDDGIAGLQEELILVKMREAEASLSIKEMRQRLAELEQHWTVSLLIHQFFSVFTYASVVIN